MHPESGIDMNDEPAYAPRKSGIRVMGEISWGTHICVFYEAEQDLLATNSSYFAAGLEDNEFCIWAVSDPIDAEMAKDALRQSIPDIDTRLVAGQMEMIPAADWYLPGGEFDMQHITGGWNEKLRSALEKGFAGMRVSGNAFWIGTSHWKEFCQYEHELDRSLAGQKMVVLCTYSLSKSRAVDLLDVARAHQFTITRRKGEWEFLETPELQAAKQEVRKLKGALDVLSDAGHAAFTARERVVLAQIVRGYSSKEIARTLGIAPRTVEFHRANLLKKTNARSTVHLLRIVLGE
ncbi:MEDS domain-containing protein [Aminobacter anthyllidis]|uniref:MEDS domain-containing protein n=2 Tax=Aminobacter anthyllidis TaxID=1035067 RepID=A0A9X1AFY6_9HYPH|nr:MEDS domain-containing protein [Aminobacter anthyllidis]